MAAIVVRPLPRSLDEILLGHSHRLTKVEFVAGPATGSLLQIEKINLNVDKEADVRRYGDATVPALSQWVPNGPEHPLDPRSGSQVQAWEGVTDDTGAELWWSQGIFFIARAGFSEGAGESVQLDLVDRAHPIKRAKSGRRWAAKGDDRILASVVAALRQVAPWVPIDIDLEGDIPFGSDAVIAEWDDDVWSKCRDLARSMSRDLHVNRDGIVVAPPLVDPLNAEPVPMLGLTARSIDLDADDVVNVVGCPWEEARPDDAPEGWTPKGGVAEWVDTVSSTSISSPMGMRRAKCGGDTSVVHTPEHAALAAQADGITRLGLQQAATGSKVPDPRDDVGIPVEANGVVHIVSKLSFSLGSGAPTSVDLGASRPDLVRMMAATTKPVGEYRMTEIVTSVTPLRSRAITDPSGSELAVTWTDALAGVEQGDPITVLHKGAGLRIGVAVLVKKNLADKHAGETVGRIGGADVTVGGNTQLRARVGTSGSYATFSGGDVTIPESSSNHTHRSVTGVSSVTLTSPITFNSPSGATGVDTPAEVYSWFVQHADAGNSLRASLMQAIARINDILSANTGNPN